MRMDFMPHYTETGAGDPLILLHGNGEDGTHFHHQIDYFSAFFRVIAVDTRGHGKSPRGDAPFTIRQFAEDLNELMNALSIEKADILGFSDGGNIAMVFAMRYPTRVRRLILNGANLNGRGVKPSVQIPIILGYHLASLFAAKSREAKRHAELLGLMVNDPNIEPQALSTITAPTLVIVGKRDMIKKSHTALIAANLPNATLVTIPGNHFIAAKNPTAFNRAVAEFLGV